MKPWTGFTSANTLHSGQETTLLALYITLMHFGGIIVPSGYTDKLKLVDGNPYRVSLTATHDKINDFDDPINAALEHLARRVVAAADRLTP